MKHFVICENDCLVEGMTKEEVISAIATATGYVPTGEEEIILDKIINQKDGNGLKMWVGTRAEYNAIAEKDESTFYHITDEKTGQEAYNLAVETQDKLNRHIEADGYINIYVHTAGALAGTGSNGKFKATVSETLSTVKVNGTSYPVNCGGEAEIELVAGAWYPFIFDGNAVNFRSGGGLGNSKLALATATEADVASGKTFYSGGKELKTGTRLKPEDQAWSVKNNDGSTSISIPVTNGEVYDIVVGYRTDEYTIGSVTQSVSGATVLSKTGAQTIIYNGYTYEKVEGFVLKATSNNITFSMRSYANVNCRYRVMYKQIA